MVIVLINERDFLGKYKNHLLHLSIVKGKEPFLLTINDLPFGEVGTV